MASRDQRNQQLIGNVVEPNDDLPHRLLGFEAKLADLIGELTEIGRGHRLGFN